MRRRVRTSDAAESTLLIDGAVAPYRRRDVTSRHLPARSPPGTADTPPPPPPAPPASAGVPRPPTERPALAASPRRRPGRQPDRVRGRPCPRRRASAW